MKVSKIMTKNPVTVSAKTTISGATKNMLAENAGTVLVAG